MSLANDYAAGFAVMRTPLLPFEELGTLDRARLQTLVARPEKSVTPSSRKMDRSAPAAGGDFCARLCWRLGRRWLARQPVSISLRWHAARSSTNWT